ncbi:MAG TPA: hypothetical protein VFJ97_01985 [Dermatophilaceae bacterium]|nr:hypothetical protein [Dermatophilaceae bacterium]
MALPWGPGARPRTAGSGHGVLLLRGSVAAAASWAGRGVVPVHVGRLGDWTVVMPAGGSQAAPPYDDPLRLLAARPVPGRLRAALGLYAVDGKAVVVAVPSGWRAIQRYAVWVPGSGVATSAELRLARPRDLLRCAGVKDRTRAGALRDILRDGLSDATTVLQRLAAALDLPAGPLLDHTTSPAALGEHRIVEPSVKSVRRFDDTIAQDARQRAELEGR